MRISVGIEIKNTTHEVLDFRYIVTWLPKNSQVIRREDPLIHYEAQDSLITLTGFLSVIKESLCYLITVTRYCICVVHAHMHPYNCIAVFHNTRMLNTK